MISDIRLSPKAIRAVTFNLYSNFFDNAGKTQEFRADLQVKKFKIIFKKPPSRTRTIDVLAKTKKNLERFTNLRVILAQGPC